MKKAAFFLLLNSALALCASADPVPILHEGMTYAEVLKAKGAPVEKDIHETSRTAYWRYADTTLKFSSGRLVTQKTLPVKKAGLTAAEKVAAAAPGANKNLKHPISQKDVDDILSAIPNEGPEGAGAGSAPAPNNGSPFQSGQPIAADEE